MKPTLSPGLVAAMAELSGHRLEAAEASRIAAALDPAFTVFREVEATLPFDADLSGFLLAQADQEPRE